jgi:CheY-like chemotaxis protein
VLGIVRSHGGFVNVYSELGKGSVFRVYLPAQAADGPAEPSAAHAEEIPRGNGELILVVDDEASIRSVVAQTLESFGYRAVVAGDWAQGVALFAERRTEVSLILTDMMMPVMDGVALIAAVRRLDPRVKIIAASGLDANGNVAKASAALPKPYSAEVLLRA